MLEEGHCVCPMCQYDRASYRTGSLGYFTFNCACPRCGYCDNNDKAIWSAILKAEKKTLLKAKLPVTRKGLYEYEEEMRKKYD